MLKSNKRNPRYDTLRTVYFFKIISDIAVIHGRFHKSPSDYLRKGRPVWPSAFRGRYLMAKLIVIPFPCVYSVFTFHYDMSSTYIDRTFYMIR